MNTSNSLLIGYECSGKVRSAMRAAGVDAWSCDLKPAEDGSPYHITGDIRTALGDGEDLWAFLVART